MKFELSSFFVFFCGKEKMGEANNALKMYMNRQDRIKSVLEYYLGEKMPDDWQCRETGGFVAVRNSKGKLTFRERDYMGEAWAWGFHFRLGLENQKTINLTYPWRLMEWDCLAYGGEIEEIQEKNNAQDAVYGTADDYQYRYKKCDRLEPILNLMLYWGRKKWEGPLCLRDMMEDMTMLPEKLQNLVGNYKVHMISMRFIAEKDLEKMDSDLKYVLGIMRYTASRKKYIKYILENREYFKRIPKSAVDVIDACTNIKKLRENLQYCYNQESGEEETDLCKALDDIEKAAIKKGEKRGERKGERRGTLMTLFSLVNDGCLKAEEAARRAGLSEQTFLRKMKKFEV